LGICCPRRGTLIRLGAPVRLRRLETCGSPDEPGLREGLDFHGDPADRMIVATALSEGTRIITADDSILGWGGPLGRYDARRLI